VSLIEHEQIDGVHVARPRGDIDAANATLVDKELVRSLEPDGDCLVLDLGQTRYLDSAALDMLFRLHDRLRQRRGSLYLIIPPDSPLKRLVAIVGMPKLVPVHETVAEALSACSQLRNEQGPNDPAAAGTQAEGSHGLPGGHCTK
jgi:anti-anti-sigma factor